MKRVASLRELSYILVAQSTSRRVTKYFIQNYINKIVKRKTIFDQSPFQSKPIKLWEKLQTDL